MWPWIRNRKRQRLWLSEMSPRKRTDENSPAIIAGYEVFSNPVREEDG